MPNSLLMQYAEITKSLMEYGPQTKSQISSIFRTLNPVDLQHILDFLSENRIITRESTGKNLNYAITKRGIGLLDFFRIKPSKATIKLKR